MKKKHKIIVGLSGGVDSAVAALRLIELGHDVKGLFMKNWTEDDTEEYCSSAEDYADAKEVAKCLGIELISANFSDEYWEKVFKNFLKEYQSGRTPNPDILCNKNIKFKAFVDYAIGRGADYIATGHYAGIKDHNQKKQLICASDKSKDQTYFLYTLGQTALSKSIFPLEKILKSEVREIASNAGLSNWNKKDSMGICFIGKKDFKAFLSKYIPSKPGPIKDVNGEYLGDHQGLMFHTIGQRQGLGIGGKFDMSGDPWFVVEKNTSTNTLIVAQGHDNPNLLKDNLRADQVHWITDHPPEETFCCKARLRHRQELQDCRVTLVADNLNVIFDRPQRAVTPGQSIVLYEKNICLGGGIIM